VIDFHDWPEERAETFIECYDQVRRLVKPQRAKNKRATRRIRWWQYAERASGLYRTIAGLDRVIAITLVSKAVMPVMVPTGQVFAHKLAVFATDDSAILALLSSSPHWSWVIARTSTLETRINYSPSDVFETFAQPKLTSEMRKLGNLLDERRRETMLTRQAGLTKTYNLVHDVRCSDADIIDLREIHRRIDQAVTKAYGWNDLDLVHGFHETRQGIRYTVGHAAMQEILDRLLELNHERYADEAAAGLHDRKRRRLDSAGQGELFNPSHVEGK
jgi:hypothetical protein